MTLFKQPSFVVIGAPKAGTTSLFHYLRQHPAIFLPRQKELHYFSYKLLEQNISGPGDEHALAYACQTLESYRSHFQKASSQQMIGEISPSYLYFSETAKEICSTLGAIKIVVILRNPIDKAYSQYMHLVRDNRERLSFFDALMREKKRRLSGWSDFWRYAESSLYTERLEHFQKVFGCENVKVVLFDDLIQQPRYVMEQLCDFLEVSRAPLDQMKSERSFNPSGRPKSRHLSSILARPSVLKSIAKQVLPIATLERIRSVNTGAKETMDSRSYQYLVHYFERDLERLETLLGRQLPWELRTSPEKIPS